MKDLFHKLVSLVILLTFGYVVFKELFPRNNKRGPVVAELAYAETEHMFSDLGGTAGNKPVIVFVTSWCPVCKALEKDLASRNIPFVRADIEESHSAFLYYQKVTGGRIRSIPVTVVGTKAIMGFKPEHIVKELAGSAPSAATAASSVSAPRTAIAVTSSPGV